MRLNWNLLSTVLLLGSTVSGLRSPRSYYRRSYYSAAAVGPPPGSTLRLIRQGPPSYPRADLQTNESKRRDVTKKYPKKTHYRPYESEEDNYSGERYNSAEYSGESSVQDSREYTIGTQIRVQHPITIPKKASSSASYGKPHKYVTPVPYKSSSGGGGGGSGYVSDVHIASGEELSPPKRTKWTPVQYEPEPDPFHLVPPPRATVASSSNSYSVFEPDNDDYDVVPLQRPKNHDRYKNVASKKQIEAYLEDQQKLLDDAIKLQLLNNPKLKKFLKEQAQEAHDARPDLDIEDFESYPPNFSGPGPLRSKYNDDNGPPPHPPKGRRTRRRPPPRADLKRPSIPKHIIKPKRKYRSTALVINV
ncbi:uncharacterized protein Dwil_GK13109 [Drosophila willistoni]|uniref:Uncharacterized protein n=1 Tax=Drosophila willistoni TaxID=7260 RepID=B4NH02_DROWI|nr:uncharacterized protein LOC6650718 [Drosophila willistoni]EDW84499.1 uncharacterized protein Dwil_GK13109 [Drosophila willistoni]